MSTLLKSVKKFLKQISGLIPTALPGGVAEFDSWSQSIAETYSLPTSELDSIRFALASMIMHLGPQTAYKSKFYFAISIKAGAAKQIAAAAFTAIKEKQKAAQAAEAADVTQS